MLRELFLQKTTFGRELVNYIVKYTSLTVWWGRSSIG